MTQRYKNREEEILTGYVKLVEAMLINVYDKIRIKKSWHTKKISRRMFDKKQANLKEFGAWLTTDNCATWFDILGQCTGRGSRKMHETFLRVHGESVKFMKKHKKDVDKYVVDTVSKK